MRTQVLHVRTDTENKHQPFSLAVFQMHFCKYAVLTLLEFLLRDAFPGTVWPCMDCQGLPLFVYL